MRKIKSKIITLFLCATVAFSAVGFTACSNSELEAKLADLQAQITELQDQNEELQATITEQQAQIAELEQEKQELEEQIVASSIKEIVVGNEIIKELEVGGMITLNSWGPIGGQFNNAIILNFEEENVIFESIAENGYIRAADPNNVYNSTFYWELWDPSISYWPGLTYNQTFVDIVVKSGNNILGYGIVEILITEDSLSTATVLKSAMFPKVDGEYQNITQDQIRILIENMKSA